MTAPCVAPETVETHICGDTTTNGGKYDWTCVLPPHDSNIKHLKKAFRRELNDGRSHPV